MESITRYVLPGLAVALAIVALVLGGGDNPGYALMAWVGAALCACAAAIAYNTRLGTLLTAVGCLASNGYLLSRKLAADAGPSICTVSARIDCDLVNSSQYSELAGIPVTLFGVGFYAGLAVAALFAQKQAPRLHQVNALFALLSLAYSVYLAAASLSLGALCILCISIYLGNVLLLVAGLKGLRETDGKLFDDLGGVPVSRSFLTISAIFAVAVLVGNRGNSSAAVSLPGTGPRVPEPDDLTRYYAQPAGPVELDGSEPVLGDPDAPYLVVEFADFACPHCAKASKELKLLVEQEPQIQVRFKAYPLSGVCNPLLARDENDTGARCLGAVAAECAHRQGRFWEVSGNMFTNLGFLTLDALEYMASEEGVDVEAWRECIAEEGTAESVASDIQAGITAGVTGTPALFLRGTHGDDFILITYTVPDMLKVIEAHMDGVPLPAPGPAPAR